MQYFVAGATGFIGKRRVKKLMERKGVVVHFLIRKESVDKVAGLRGFWAPGPHARCRCLATLPARSWSCPQRPSTRATFTP